MRKILSDPKGIAFAALGLPSRAAQSSSKPDPKGLPSLCSAFPLDRIQPKKKRLRGARSLPFAFCIRHQPSELGWVWMQKGCKRVCSLFFL